jgi:hypothetical protein
MHSNRFFFGISYSPKLSKLSDKFSRVFAYSTFNSLNCFIFISIKPLITIFGFFFYCKNLKMKHKLKRIVAYCSYQSPYFNKKKVLAHKQPSLFFSFSPYLFKIEDSFMRAYSLLKNFCYHNLSLLSFIPYNTCLWHFQFY